MLGKREIPHCIGASWCKKRKGNLFWGRPQCVGECFDDLFASQLRIFGVWFPPKKRQGESILVSSSIFQVPSMLISGTVTWESKTNSARHQKNIQLHHQTDCSKDEQPSSSLDNGQVWHVACDTDTLNHETPRVWWKMRFPFHEFIPKIFQVHVIHLEKLHNHSIMIAWYWGNPYQTQSILGYVHHLRDVSQLGHFPL